MNTNKKYKARSANLRKKKSRKGKCMMMIQGVSLFSQVFVVSLFFFFFRRIRMTFLPTAHVRKLLTLFFTAHVRD